MQVKSLADLTTGYYLKNISMYMYMHMQARVQWWGAKGLGPPLEKLKSKHKKVRAILSYFTYILLLF